MSIRKTVCCSALLLSAAVFPLFAGVPEQIGKDNATSRIAAAIDKQTQALTGLLEKLPPQALPAVQDALNASMQGRNAALTALAGHSGADAADSVEAPDAETPGATVGLAHARETVSASFEKSMATLQELLTKLPEKAVPHVEAALASIQEGRARALQNLDALIARGISDRASTNLSSRPDRLTRPERPARPERMERPQLPERPQRPERPAAAGRS